MGADSMADEVDQWLTELLRLSDDDKVTEKQMKIISAAVEIFAQKGYAATSTSEIAQKAGVAEGTIFRHYKTKKDLLLSIVTPIMTQLVAPFALRDLHKVLDSPYNTYEEFLRAVMRNRIEFAKKNTPVLRVLLHEIPFHPELQAQFQEHVAAKIVDRMRSVVQRFQDAGQLVDMPSDTLMRVAASVVIGYALTRLFVLPNYDWDDEREIDMMVELLLHGMERKDG